MKRPISTILMFALLAVGYRPQQAAAQDWQTLVQPIGTVVQLWQPGDVNTLLESWDPFIIPGVTDPFDLGTLITEIQPSVQQHFVRFYGPSGNAIGPWMMRSQFVRGLTPERIRDIYSLPELPTHVVNVEVPAGSQYGLWTGITAPVLSPGYMWGQGGGQSTRLIYNLADFPNYQLLPADAFQHPQPIGQYALSYRPLAGHGNPHRVAAYLDRHIPAPYSDMETVYTALDYLNWIGFGEEPLQQALDDISPERFATVPFTLWRNTLLFGNALFDRRPRPYQCEPACALEADNCSCWPRLSLIGLGELGTGETRLHGRTFDYNTWGVAATADRVVCGNLFAGAAFSALFNNFSWHRNGGNGRTTHLQGGLYADYVVSRYFFGMVVTGGWNDGNCHRKIHFTGIDRTAKSHQSGGDFSVQLQEGLNICFCDDWRFTPLLRLVYSCISEKGFRERGADSLDLNVRPWTTEIVRAYIEGAFSRSFALDIGCLNGRVYGAFAHDCVIGGKHIRGYFDPLGDSFGVDAWCRDQDSALVGAVINLATECGLNAYVRYDAQFNPRYTAQAAQVGADWQF